MKQSAVKTLGVAALGVAFAAVGAGAASAAPAAPAATPALDTVSKTLPAENVSQALPAAGAALAQGQNAVGQAPAAQPAVGRVLAEGPSGPIHGRIGGLPLQSTGLPTQNMLMNGIPLG
ncbi:ATP-binding protein [Streptomyces sp. NPDC101151]|uniref:ATP-binding protein n=1 Tax=Streptomyces sp. NPDC101151 TaxID=3366115 RepID=UPI0038141AD3